MLADRGTRCRDPRFPCYGFGNVGTLTGLISHPWDPSLIRGPVDFRQECWFAGRLGALDASVRDPSGSPELNAALVALILPVGSIITTISVPRSWHLATLTPVDGESSWLLSSPWRPPRAAGLPCAGRSPPAHAGELDQTSEGGGAWCR